ncbi:hypothetical protein ACLBW8_27375 [Pseudomonas sp. M5A4_2d]
MKKVLLLLPFLLVACGGESQNIGIVKNQVIKDLDPSRTLGAALEHRERCSSYEWSESVDAGGRQVVTYKCQLRPSASNDVLQASYSRIATDIESAISTYHQLIDLQKKTPPCTFEDDSSVSACDVMKQGKLKQIAASEQGLERLGKIRRNDIDSLQQLISWGVIGNPAAVVLLSAKYQIKMDDNQVYTLGQGREAMLDVYSNNEGYSPVTKLARQLFVPTCVNCQ